MAVAALLSSGCATLSYYGQAARGHLDLMRRAKPIDRLLRDPGTGAELRKRLRRVQRMRRFAVERLGLPDNASYTRYAQLDRDAVVWSLVATPEFSLEPRQWCYPVLGCASYRGYFDKARAEQHGARLAAAGWDMVVEPVPAYSTLKWFSDPLPSTVIRWSAAEIAGLIFHELAHQRVYVRDDSAFNEAYASMVEEAGVIAWLNAQGDPRALALWQQSKRREARLNQLLRSTRQHLRELYETDLAPPRARIRKRMLFEALQRGYRRLKREQWQGYAGYDQWMAGVTNNARMASIATYHHWLPAFRALLAEVGGDLRRFHERVGVLARLPKARRDAELSHRLGDD